MRWIKSPFIILALIVVAAAVIIYFVSGAQNASQAPAAVSGERTEQALILQGSAFATPDGSPEQTFTVTRDAQDAPAALQISVLPNQPPPTPAEQGVRILLTPEDAALIEDTAVSIEVSYSPLASGAASGLALSLQGIGPSEWIVQPIGATAGTVTFELPPQFAVNAIGLRAMSDQTDAPRGLEITRLVLRPTVTVSAPPTESVPPPE